MTGKRALSEQQAHTKREPRPARGSRPVRRPPLRYLSGGEIISYTMSGTDTRPLNSLMNTIECIPSYAVIDRGVALYLQFKVSLPNGRVYRFARHGYNLVAPSSDNPL